MTKLTDYPKIPLWPASGLGLHERPERDFGVLGELCHVAAHLETLDSLISIAIFLYPLPYSCVALCSFYHSFNPHDLNNAIDIFKAIFAFGDFNCTEPLGDHKQTLI